MNVKRKQKIMESVSDILLLLLQVIYKNRVLKYLFFKVSIAFTVFVHALFRWFWLVQHSVKIYFP
jgi:hypothetical protein